MKINPPPFAENKKKLFKEAAKTGEFIYFIGEGELRKKSKEVPINKIKTQEFKTKVKFLKKCLLRYRRITGKGRGISAIQVGIRKTFFVVYLPETKKLLTIVNPKITKKSKDFYHYNESCMSASPLFAKVKRPAWIEFEYYDEKGIKKYWKEKGEKSLLLNRVFQHEIDHMNGIINIDCVDSKDLVFGLDPKLYEKAKFEKVSK